VLDITTSRCLSIIAHIDHGKSTLADRILEITGAVQMRDMKAQYLDSMDIERERGITIKAQNVRVPWKGATLHLVDTPGHVDFGYEVSRSLAACEGVILLVDAGPGHRGADAGQLLPRLENDLEIVAALNKIDLPAAEPEPLRGGDRAGARHPRRRHPPHQRQDRRGRRPSSRRRRRAHPPPGGRPDAGPAGPRSSTPPSTSTGGVVSSVRVVNGTMRTGDKLGFMQAGATHEADEIGVRAPVPTPVGRPRPGRGRLPHRRHQGRRRGPLGRDGDLGGQGGDRAAAGYLDPKPMVFCGIFPVDGDEFEDLREALEKLRLNDASFTYEPESSGALGFGFRCGFLGLLHMEIVRERLEREFGLTLIATAPSVGYIVLTANGERFEVDNPADMPPAAEVEAIEEPFLRVTILTPTEYTGTLMELCQERRGEMEKMEYLSPERLELVYRMPLGEVVVDFFDQMKSRTKGYASLDYEPAGYAAVEPREGRHHAERRPRRRLLHHRPPGQGLRLRAAHGREAARAHPPPDVRRAHPGRRSGPGSSPARR
jgi:GTP-binding protein LepA